MRLTNFARTILCALLLLALAFLTSSVPTSAQNLYGTIRGTVTDQSGAAIPDVTITATNTATAITHTAVSEADGSYQILQLQVGDYTVKAVKSGFQTSTTTAFHLNVSQVYVQDIKLQLGTVSQEVKVESNMAQVDTTTMQLGGTLTGQTITSMPLNGRNWTELQQLQPGVVGASDRFASGTGGAYSVNGSETQQNEFLVNGIDTNDAPLNTPGIIPSPDAIAEFRMVTSTQNPEYGRNSGSTINAIIKSGTNGFHGDAFEFYRDTFLDARSYFQKTVSPFHQNQFGGTFGGPVRKDHTFFFASYQGARSFSPQSGGTTTVFSQAERGGDFSADTGGAFPLVNPSTKTQAVSPFSMVGADGNTYPAGTPYNTLFPAGVIPSADLNLLALKLMNQFVPLPNAAGNLYEFNPSSPFIDDQLLYRVDETLTANDQIWGYGLWERHPDTSTLPFTGASLPGFESEDQRHYQEYTVAWTHTFSGNTLNEARIGYFRFNFDAVVPVSPISPTSYGFSGIIPQTNAGASLPVIGLNGYFTLGFSANGPQPRIDQTYQVIDNFSKVIGNHTLKMGFHMERMEVFNPFNNNLSGNFSFNGSGTFSTGFPGADFLLGIPDTYAQGSGTIINARGREYYSYLQDQWQARKNLTLTLGLVWDVETPWQDLYDKGLTMAGFIPGEQSTIFPTAPVGVVYPGDPGMNKYGGPSIPWHDIGPRIGFAWSPDLGWLSGGAGKTSIRGGIGLYYNRTEEELTLQGLTNPPFALTSSGVAAIGGSPSFADPFSGWCPGTGGAAPTACSTAQLFPFTPPAPGSSVDFTPYEPIGFGMNTLSRKFGVPRATNFNLTVERQVTPSTIVTAGYVGEIGRHLEGAYDLNPAGAAPGVNPGAAALGCTAFDLATCDPGSFAYDPNIYGQMGFQATEFNSNYNSMQVEVNKHFTHGLQFLLAYTWSRYFDDTSSLENSAFNAPGINPLDFGSMYAPSANDAPQRLVASWVYTLPFYSLTHRFQRLTDGWNLVGIAAFQHGLPVRVYNSSDSSLTCDPNINFYACPDRANRTTTPLGIANPRTFIIKGKNMWFNPAAFAQPAPGTGIGDALRNPLYGPGINNWDISLIKDIHVDEARYFELRLETFNTFNHNQFSNPNGNVASSNFGRITGVISGSTNGGGRVMQLGGKFYF